MIIKSIKTKIVSVPFSDPPKTGFLTLEKIDLLIVQVETKDGIIGTGYLHPLAGGLKTLEMCVNEMLKPLLKILKLCGQKCGMRHSYKGEWG